MATPTMNRRRLLVSGGAALLLGACTGGRGGLGNLGVPNLAGVLKDLLGISSQRAFARLLQPDGFLNDQLARLELPGQLKGSNGILSALLQTPAVQNQLLEQVNGAAGFAARAAEPVVDDAISRLTFADAGRVLRGGPQAATLVLQGRIGESLGAQIVPAALRGLGVGNSDIVTRVLSSVSGFDIDALASDVGQQASASIFKAIGREEAAIRENPQSTNNPALISALTLLG
ncbi:MAG: DUF4197 family protein [Pacificimonas sp.]